MGYHEAVRDGIRLEKRRSGSVYHPPCKLCGKGVPSLTYKPDYPYLCPACRPFRELMLDLGWLSKDESKCD